MCCACVGMYMCCVSACNVSVSSVSVCVYRHVRVELNPEKTAKNVTITGWR